MRAKSRCVEIGTGGLVRSASGNEKRVDAQPEGKYLIIMESNTHTVEAG